MGVITKLTSVCVSFIDRAAGTDRITGEYTGEVSRRRLYADGALIAELSVKAFSVTLVVPSGESVVFRYTEEGDGGGEIRAYLWAAADTTAGTMVLDVNDATLIT